MAEPLHPPQLYALTRLVRAWMQEQTGRDPQPQEVALCLAGAYGVLSGLGLADDAACANAQEQARQISATWKRDTIH